jgi:putative MATE family efflux protein
MQQRTDLLNGPIDSSLRLFAIPMAFSFMVNMVYSLIDRFYVSKLGVQAIAAIGTVDQVTFLMFTLVSGIAVGSSIIVSRRFGEGDRDGANRTATQSIVFMAALSLLVTIGMYLLMPSLPAIMSMKQDAAPLAIAYMSTLYLGFAANLVSFQIFAIVRSTGNPMFPMMVLIGTTILNAVLAPFLIFGIGPFPHMGMSGAGLATAVAQLSGCAFALWAVTTGNASVHLTFRGFRPNPQLLGNVAKLGFPSAVQMVSVSVKRAIIFKLVGGFGTAVTAAYTLGLNVDMLVFMSVFAVGVSLEVATGQNLGAGKPERAAAYHRSAIKQMAILMVVLGSIVWVFGEDFVRLYVDKGADLVLVREGVRYLHTTVFGYVMFAVGVVTVRSISGAGAAYVSMAITAGSLLLFQLPISYLLAHGWNWGPQGVWYGIVIGYAVFAVVSLLVHRMNFWRKVAV